MTPDPAEARRLLSLLRERPSSVDPARDEARRDRVLPWLVRHVAASAEQRRRVRHARLSAVALAAALSAAAAVVLALRFTGPAAPPTAILAVEGTLVHRVSGTARAVAAGDRLPVPVAGELETAARSPATLEALGGVRLSLGGGSRLGLAGMGASGEDRSVELGQGQLECAVPKLPAGTRFSVVTPNARVVVHGTQFAVRVDSSEAGVTRTCVRVTEGVVSVVHGAGSATLRAGDAWGCEAERPAGPVAAVEKGAPRRQASATTPVPPRRVDKTGTLAEETALLQTALAAERQGQRAAAQAALMRLLTRYPTSPLAAEARTVLDRVSRGPAGDP